MSRTERNVVETNSQSLEFAPKKIRRAINRRLRWQRVGLLTMEGATAVVGLGGIAGSLYLNFKVLGVEPDPLEGQIFIPLVVAEGTVPAIPLAWGTSRFSDRLDQHRKNELFKIEQLHPDWLISPPPKREIVSFLRNTPNQIVK